MTTAEYASSSPSSDCPPIWVTGEVDIASVPRLRRALERALPDLSGRVVVDLSGVTFMDCSGLAPLLEAEARLGGQLSLRGVPARVLALLHLADLQAWFRVTDAVAERSEDALAKSPEDALGISEPLGDAPPGIVELEEKVAGQRAKVSGRARIDQAKGLVMAAHGCDAEQAWQMLFRASRTQGVQVHDLADALTDAASGRDMDQSSAAMRAAVLAVMAQDGEVHDDIPDREDRPAPAHHDVRSPRDLASEAT